MKKILLTIASLFLIFQIALTQSADDAKNHLYYHRYQSAAKILNTVISRPGHSTDAYYWLSETYYDQAKADSAAMIIQQGMNYFRSQGISAKDAVLLHAGWVRHLLETGQMAEANQMADQIISETRGKNATAYWAMARAHIDSKKGDPARALDFLEKAKKRDRKNPAIYTAMGDAHRKMIDASSAIPAYDEALRKDPGYAEAMYKKGLIYKTQKNVEIYLDRFTKAYNLDTTYAPAIYELYYHYFYRNLATAGKFLHAYLRHSDPDISHHYMLTDYLYVSKKYDEAIQLAKNILQGEGSKAQPRLYKLIAYSYDEKGDSVTALNNMKMYFEKQDTSGYVTKDFELMAKLLDQVNNDKIGAIEWYRKALAHEKDRQEKLEYMNTLAQMQKEVGNRDKEALWRERIYKIKDRPSNMDIFNWGVALYTSEEYQKADSVFGIYAEKYPEQVHGFLWRARCNAQIDSTMEKGLAVPYYKKLISVAQKDQKKNKTLLLGAYGYLGSYEANTTKDYPASLGYFDKMLEIDPENADAQKYAGIVRQWIESGAESDSGNN